MTRLRNNIFSIFFFKKRDRTQISHLIIKEILFLPKMVDFGVGCYLKPLVSKTFSVYNEIVKMQVIGWKESMSRKNTIKPIGEQLIPASIYLKDPFQASVVIIIVACVVCRWLY